MSGVRTPIIIGALALVAGIVVGCGGGDDTTADAGNPEDVVQAFYAASKSGDAEAACATFSAASQEAAAQGADSCEAAFDASFEAEGAAGVPDELSIDGSTIDGDTATVEVTGDGSPSSFTLVNEDGWKIDLTASISTDSSTGTDATTG